MTTQSASIPLALLVAGFMASSATAGPNANLPNPTNGRSEAFFVATNVYAFHLTIAPDRWAIMGEVGGGRQPPPGRGRGRGPGPGNNGPMPSAEFKKGTALLEFQGQPFGAIRVRFKGNSSFRFAGSSLKRSLKLDFNDLEKGRTFFGLSKLNLNNNAMDPSQLREALAYQIFRGGGVPAGRTAFAEVYLTVPGKYAKAYAGLYTVVEQVDERFLKARFGSKEGLLLKPDHMPGLPFLGTSWAAYTNQAQPKTAVAQADASRFIEFAKCLNSADDASFGAAVADFVDVDEFLRFLALEGLLANMDSPLLTGHNYYLYLHPKTRKLLWIPWDLNEAFGGFNPAGTLSEQMNLSVDQPFTQVNRLAGRLLQVPGMKARYHEIFRSLLANNFTATNLFPMIEAMARAIRPSLTNDRMVSLPQFEASLSERSQPDFGWGARGGRGGAGAPQRSREALKPFINQRAASVRLQLEGRKNGYVPRDIRPGPGGGPMPPGPPLGLLAI
jgi:spore coat protein H